MENKSFLKQLTMFLFERSYLRSLHRLSGCQNEMLGFGKCLTAEVWFFGSWRIIFLVVVKMIAMTAV